MKFKKCIDDISASENEPIMSFRDKTDNNFCKSKSHSKSIAGLYISKNATALLTGTFSIILMQQAKTESMETHDVADNFIENLEIDLLFAFYLQKKLLEVW